MTTNSSQAPNPWADPLLRAIAQLRELFATAQARMDSDAREDFSRLFEGATRLERMLADPVQAANRHDLMNVLAAIRGYAEMLREDIGPQHPDVDDTLFTCWRRSIAPMQGTIPRP